VYNVYAFRIVSSSNVKYRDAATPIVLRIYLNLSAIFMHDSSLTIYDG
jgi:hypothetical protein